MTEQDEVVKQIQSLKLKIAPKRGDRHNLSPLMKRLKGTSNEAVDALKELMKSDDEKIRLEAAKTLIKFQLDVSKEITDNNIKALLTEAKFGAPSVGIKDIDTRPLVDFGTIKDV